MSNFWIVLFVFSACLIVYTLFGYPLLLALLARFAEKPVRKGPVTKTVSVLIPIRNGEQFVKSKLESVLRVKYPRNLLEILVISDGSEDRTDELVQEFAAHGVQLVRLPRAGKAAALNAGRSRAHGEIILFTDVRQPLHPESLGRLMSCFADPTVGVVSGELRIMKGETREEADVGLYWRYETWIRDRLSRIDSMFGATGPFYAMRRELTVPIPPDILLDDVYLPINAFFRGYRLVVEPTAIAFDYPTSLQSEFLRKVRTLAGNYQIIRCRPELLGPSNRMWLHFISYKVARLLLPYAFLILALSTFGLPQPWRDAALAGQSFFYAIAALDVWIPKEWTLKRVSSIVRTFIVLMAAAACAVSVFFVSPRTLWRETRVRAEKSHFP